MIPAGIELLTLGFTTIIIRDFLQNFQMRPIYANFRVTEMDKNKFNPDFLVIPDKYSFFSQKNQSADTIIRFL